MRQHSHQYPSTIQSKGRGPSHTKVGLFHTETHRVNKATRETKNSLGLIDRCVRLWLEESEALPNAGF